MYFDAPHVEINEKQHEGAADAIRCSEQDVFQDRGNANLDIQRFWEEDGVACHGAVHAQVKAVLVLLSCFYVLVAKDDESATGCHHAVLAKEASQAA